MAPIKLYTVKGPGGECVMNEAQAKEKEKQDGYSILGEFSKNPFVKNVTEKEEKKDSDVEVPEEDNEFLSELKGIRSNSDLADFIEKNEIDIDPEDFDGFKELKEAVAEMLG